MRFYGTVAIVAFALALMMIGAKAEDWSKFKWPKNNRFVCASELIRNEKTLQLKRNETNLAWCDAEIAPEDEAKVLKVCALNRRCEIKGIIMGHGAFGWQKFYSIRQLP